MNKEITIDGQTYVLKEEKQEEPKYNFSDFIKLSCGEIVIKGNEKEIVIKEKYFEYNERYDTESETNPDYEKCKMSDLKPFDVFIIKGCLDSIDISDFYIFIKKDDDNGYCLNYLSDEDMLNRYVYRNYEDIEVIRFKRE